MALLSIPATAFGGEGDQAEFVPEDALKMVVYYYWQKVPADSHPSDSMAPTPQGYEPVQLVGLADHSALFAHAAY